MNRRLIAGLVTASVLALTACGGSGPRPGVAVAVGDEVITSEQVDDGARGLCAFFAEEVEQQGAVAYRTVRQTVAVLLTLRQSVDELAAETGAEPDSDYRRELSRLESEAERLESEAEREALVASIGAQDYVLAMIPEIGAALLREEGETDPELAAAERRGLEALTDYLADADVRFDPSLGLAYQDIQLPPADADVATDQILGSLFDSRDQSASLGVSETAEQGVQADPEYAASLPANQRCGG